MTTSKKTFRSFNLAESEMGQAWSALRVLALFALPIVSALPSLGAPGTVVAPFGASQDYITQGVVVGAKTGPHRSAITTRFTGEPAATIRPLSVHPDTSLNGELTRDHAARLGSRPLPPIFGGFTAIVYGMKEPAPFTTRTQFHDSPSGRNDFINLHVYVESPNPQPAGLEFSFSGALLFPAGEAGAARIVQREKIAYVSFILASQRPHARIARVIVRDADKGDFYISELTSTENKGSIALTGSKWALIHPADLTVTGEYRPAPFQRADHIGVYLTIPVTELADGLPAFGVICNTALHAFEYTLLP